jgi:hypothetical protein
MEMVDLEDSCQTVEPRDVVWSKSDDSREETAVTRRPSIGTEPRYSGSPAVGRGIRVCRAGIVLRVLV